MCTDHRSSGYNPDDHQLYPDILCRPTKLKENFQDYGSADEEACSDPITEQVGVAKAFSTEFTRDSTSFGSRLWNCFGSGCFTRVSEVVVQSNVIGGQPTNSWKTLYTEKDVIDIAWTYGFQYFGEQIRVCFVSGVTGVVYATVYSGLLQ